MKPTRDLAVLSTDEVSRRGWQREASQSRVAPVLSEESTNAGGHPRKVLSVVDRRFLLNELKAGTEQRLIALGLAQRRFARLSRAEKSDPVRVRESQVSESWLSKYIARLEQ